MATWGPIQLRLKGSRQVEFDGEASPAPGGGSMPGWTGPFIIRPAEIQTLTVDSAGSGTFTLSDLDFQTAWQAFTVFNEGECIIPTAPNGHAYRATVSGRTGENEPVWPTDGGTVVDFDTTWEDIGEAPLATAAIPFDATAVAVQAALDAIAPGKFTCTGGPLNTDPVTVTVAADVPCIVLTVADSTDGTTTCVCESSTVDNDDDSRGIELGPLAAGTILEDVLVERWIPFSPGGPQVLIETHLQGDGGDDFYSPTGNRLEPTLRDVAAYVGGNRGTQPEGGTAPSVATAAIDAEANQPLDLPALIKRDTPLTLLLDGSMAAQVVGELRVYLKASTPTAP